MIEEIHRRGCLGWLGIVPRQPGQALTRLEGRSDQHQDAARFLVFRSGGRAEWRPPVKRSSYGERDYAFGQMMLTLRTHIGLTQAGLAELLHVSRRAVAEWEAGSAYPKAEHLK